MRFDVMGHPSDFPAIAEFHNQQDERKCEIGCCGCDRNGHAHHSTSPSASAGRVFSAVSVGVLVGAAEKLSPPFSPRMLVSAV